MLTRQSASDRPAARPTPRGYTWRPLRAGDVPALYHLLLAAARADDRTHVVGSLDDMRRQFDDPWCLPENDSWAAFTRTFMNPEAQPGGERRVFIDLAFEKPINSEQ